MFWILPKIAERYICELLLPDKDFKQSDSDLSFCKIASHTKVYLHSDTEIIVESEFL